MTEPPVVFLDVDDLVMLAVALLGDPPPVRDAGLLAAAAARPQASAFGDDAYADVWAKAAALLHSIVSTHPLIDGNKRLGWLACAVFLEIDGVPATSAGNDDVFDLVWEIASPSMEVAEIADGLRRIVTAKG